MKKILILLLVISPALLAQTSKTGRITVGHYANGPGLPIPCNAADQWNTDDGHGAYICVTANSWQQIGGGGTNYQTIQTAGVSVTQEPKLNFVNVPCVDNAGNNSTDCTASYQTIQNNAVSLTQRPLLNFVPPLTATDNGANTRTDINCPSAVGVGGSHSSGCVPDPGASGTTTDYLGRDMLYHASGSASTVKPDPSTAVQYVAATCNGGGACTDANDGLTWGTAKLTVYNAACALPTGNCGTQTAGAGTIFVGPSATFNPTSGDGIWLMGSTDPNYASPPAGWLKFPNTASLNVIGVPNAITGPNGHKPTVLVNFGSETDRVHPAVWLSDVVSGFYMSDFHFQYMGRAVVIGECSNGDRTGTCGTQSVILDNVSAQVNQTATNGPCTDIASNVFWIWMRDGGCAGNAYSATGAPTSDNSAAILLDGSAGSGSGLVYVVDYQLAGGGIKVKQGSNGDSLYARNVIEEGDFTHPLPPAVWFTAWSLSADAVLDNVQTADGGPNSLNAIQNDGDPSGIYNGPTVLNSNGVTGSATIINQTNQNTTPATQSPLVQRQAGSFNQYIVGRSDIARRMLDLSSTRFANLTFTNPVGWTGITIATPNQPDPFGGTLAEKIANNTSSQATATLGPNTAYTPTAGDWLVGGVWAQGLAQTGDSLVISATGSPVPTYSTNIKNRGMQVGDGQWQFLSQVSKVASGSATNINLQVKYTNTITPTLYGPVLYIIPAGTLSDSEVVEFANAMNSVDNNCAIASICNVAGHPISADVYTIRTTAVPTPAGSTGITQLYMDSTSNWPSFKANGNTAYSIAGFLAGAPVNSDCVKWVVAGGTTTLGDAGAACGSGGGGNVSNALLNSFAIYTGAGVTNQIGGVAGPTTPASVTQFVTYTPNGTVSGAPTVQLAGIPVRTFGGSPSDTIAATDRNSLVVETFGGAVTLNASSTLFNNGFAFKVASRTLNNVLTVTPSSGTCNGASTCTMVQGENGIFTLDASGSNLLADIHPPHLVAGSGITITPGDYSWTISAPGAVGTTGSPAAGNLAKFSAAATITNGDLSGDCTTSGTLTITCQKINGTSVPAGGALTTNTVPVVTGVAAVTYETVPNAALTNSATTPNGQTCTLGSTCNVNSGAASHSMSLNEGAGAAITGLALTVNQIPVGVASADPAAGNLSELSATLYAADTSGSSTAYVACSTPSAAALHTGQVILFKAGNANTTNNPTLAWCGLVAKTIVSINGAVLANNDILSTQVASLIYDGTNFELQNPQTNIASTSVRWDQINNSNANKNLNNGAFTTTFTQSSNIAWIWQNTTAATNATQQTPPTMALIGQYCTVASTCGSAADQWRFRPTFTSAVNPPSTLVIEHSGSSGTALVQMPNVADLGTLTVGTSVTAGASGTAGTYLAFPSSGNFTTTWGSAATASNTILGFATAPTTGDIVTCTTSSTTCTLTDSAILGTNVVTNTVGSAAAANQVIVSGGANKTVQAIDFPERYFIPAANCNNTTAGAGWSIGSGGTVTCRAGTNNLGGYITITDTSSTFAQFMLTIPFDWDTATNPYIRFFFSSATDTTNGHTVIPQVKVSCPTAGNGTVNDDHAFAAAHSSSTVTFGASAVANGFYNGSNVQFNSTDMTGCIAGGLMIVQVGRATDTATGNINFWGADVTFPRLLTVGAE